MAKEHQTGGFNDVPGRIENEGQTISLKFEKVTQNIGQISWNIPKPTFGCDQTSQAYNGIVVVASNEPIREDEKPVDGQFYTGDPTVDANLHAGDKLGDALVVGAFYDDKSTDELQFTDLESKTPYYIAAFAVDAQGRYHHGGVHAYSMPWGGKPDDPTPGYQRVLLDVEMNTAPFDIIQFQGHASGVRGPQPTGLHVNKDYCFKMREDTKKEFIEYTVKGNRSQTYDDLIGEINRQFALSENAPQSTNHPKSGAYYYDLTTGTLFRWDGESHIQKPVINSDVNPSTEDVGEFWYNPDTEQLNRWDGSQWTSQTYFHFNRNPATELTGKDFWFDGNKARRWEGGTWCDVPTFVQNDDPSAKPTLDVGSYWLNTNDMVLYRYDPDCNDWNSVDVLASSFDPQNIAPGYFWVDDEQEILYVRDQADTSWNEYSVRYEFSTSQPTNPAQDTGWFNTDTGGLFFFDSISGWVPETDYIIHFEDPAERQSCDLWLNDNTNTLYIWDNLNNEWDQVNYYVEQGTDPTNAPTIEVNSVWKKQNKFSRWDGTDWVDVSIISYSTDPAAPSTSDYYVTDDDQWFTWDGNNWTAIDPTYTKDDPYTPTAGTFWFDTTNQLLYEFNGTSWVSMTYEIQPLTPSIGFVYYNTTDEKLYTWNGSSYIEATLKVSAALTEKGNMVFISGTTGSESYVELKNCVEDDLLGSLNETHHMPPPQPGTDGVPTVQSWAMYGVGDDGTTDERRTMVQNVLFRLGYPVVESELSKDQIDRTVDIALEEFRKRSASAYRRGFFFLDIKPGQQVYELSNRKAGFHKISQVMAAHRIQSSFLGNATGQGAYGQAMLQHLYQMGSFDLLSYHIVSDYVELMNHMFAAYLVFSWDEDSRQLAFHQTFGADERVLLDVMVERTEQQLMRDRIVKSWIEKYALGQAQLMLAQIRGKYGSLPGAGGGVTLNAQDLMSRGDANIQDCLEQIEDFTANEVERVGYQGGFILG